MTTRREQVPVATSEEPVRLLLPARPDSVRLARLLASAIAAGDSFDGDAVADIRIAVDELCGALLETSSQPLVLSFELTDEALVVKGRSEGARPLEVDPVRMELSARVLEVVADEYELTTEGGDGVFVLVKRKAR